MEYDFSELPPPGKSFEVKNEDGPVYDFSDLDSQRKEEDNAARMRAAAVKTAGIAPEHAAKLHALSNKSGYTVDRVELDPSGVEKELQVKAVDYGRIAKDSPATAKFLGQPINKAVTRVEDIDKLEGMEYLWRVLQRGPESAAQQRKRSELGYKLLSGDDLEAEAQLSAIPKVKESENWLAEAYTSAFQFGEQMITPAYRNRNEIGAGALGMAGIAALASGPPMGQRAITVPGAAMAGASMMYTQKMTEGMYEMEAGSAFLDFRDITTMDGRKIDPSIARVAAQVYGAAASGLEMTGLGVFSKLLKKSGGKAAFKALIKKGLKNPTTLKAIGSVLAKHSLAALSEGSTEAIQELTQAFIGKQAKNADGGYYEREDWGGHINDAVNVFRQTASGAFLLSAPNLGFQSVSAHKQAQVSKVHLNALDAIAEQAQSSELCKTSPAQYEEFVQSAAKEHNGATHVFVAPEAVQTYFQEHDENLLQDLGLNEQELNDHVNAQEYIEIPIGKATAQIMGNKERHAALKYDMKFSPFDATQREVNESGPETDWAMKEYEEAQAVKMAKHKEALGRINTMAGSMVNELQISKTDATAYATLIEQRAQADAALSGTTADEFYKRNNIRFEGVNSSPTTEGGQAYSQTLENLAGDAGTMIESAIAELQKNVANGLPVSILPDAGHAPKSVQDEIAARGGFIVPGATDGQNIFLFADALQDAGSAVETWTHEQFHHGLLKSFSEKFGETGKQEFDSFLDQAFNVLGDDLKPIVDEYKLDTTDSRHRRIAVEEFLAATVGKLGNGEVLSQSEVSAFERLLNLIRDFLRERGIVDLNDDDIRRVIADAVRWTQDGSVKQESYNQEYGKEGTASGQLGQIVFNEGQTVIRIFKGANPSTVLHETGHLFWQDIHNQVEAGNAPKSVIKDHAIYFSWLGGQSKQIFNEVVKRENTLKKRYNKAKTEALKAEAGKALEEYSTLRAQLVRAGGAAYIKGFAKQKTLTGKTAIDREIVTRFHEHFARGFERYLMEGVAPSESLRPVFQKFRKWLLNIYRTVKGLNVNLNDSVRRAFDRMLATEQEMEDLKNINAGENLFNENDESLTEQEREEYNRLSAEAIEAAEKRVYSKARSRRAEYAANAKEWIRLDKAQETAYFLSRGYFPGGGKNKDVHYVGIGLNRDWLVKEYGLDVLENIQRTVPPIVKKDGEIPDIAVGHLPGDWFADGYELVEALIGLPPRKSVIDGYIQMQEEEDRRLIDEDPSYQSEERAKLLDTEIKILGRKLGSGKKIALQILKEKVREKVDSLPVKEATRYDLTLNAVRRFSRIAHNEFKAGNLEAAYHARKQQQFAELEVQARIKARERVEKIRAKVNRIAKQKKLTFEHREHILDIGQRYGLLSPSLQTKRPEELKSLSEVLKEDGAIIDASPVFSAWLKNHEKGGDYRETLTLGELNEVEDMINFLESRGRHEVEKMATLKDVTVATVADICQKQMQRMKGKKVYAKGSLTRKLTTLGRKWLPELTMMEFLFQEADGTNFGPDGDIGPNEKYIVSALAKAGSDKKALAGKINASLEKHLKQLFETKRKGPQRFKIDGVPVLEKMKDHGEFSWTIEHIICVALNMGNEGNLKALQKGYHLTREQIDLLTDRLSQKDWDAIQGVWDAIDELFPYIDNVHLTLNNFKLKKVQPKTLQTKHGEYRGGYYPLIFDGRFAPKIARWQEADDLLNSHEAMFQTPSTKSGFSKERTGGGLPPKLSMNVLAQHIADTIHYVTHAPIIKDVDAITRTPEYESGFTRVFGVESYNQIRPWLKHIARPERIAADFSERTFEKFRKLSTIAILGLNFSVAAKQKFSIFGAINDVGGDSVARGYLDMMKGGHRLVDEIDTLSPYMANRATSMDREIGEQCRLLSPDQKSLRLLGKDITLQDVQNSMFFMIRAMDAATVYPIWQGSYKKGMQKFNGNVDKAVSYADSIVRRSQPSADPMDQAHWQRTGGMKRLFSMFMTFTLKYGNRQRSNFRAWRQGDIKNGQYARHVLLEHILAPLTMQTFISLIASGDLPEGEEYLYGFLGYWLCGLPVASGVVGMAAYGRGLGDSPAMQGFDVTERLFHSAINTFKEGGDEEDAKRMIWASADALGYVVGVPAARLVKNFMTGLEQWQEGETSNPFNFVIKKPRRRD